MIHFQGETEIFHLDLLEYSLKDMELYVLGNILETGPCEIFHEIFQGLVCGVETCVTTRLSDTSRRLLCWATSALVELCL